MTLYLVRHGSAGIRHDGDALDTTRHLDDNGRAQADTVHAMLATEPITRVYSSAADRCIETVAPLAASLGVEIEVDPRLFEGSDIESTWGLVEGLAQRGRTAVLCSHGDIIPEVIARAKGRGMSISGKAGCSKGSIWILNWDGDRFVSGTYVKNKPW